MQHSMWAKTHGIRPKFRSRTHDHRFRASATHTHTCRQWRHIRYMESARNCVTTGSTQTVGLEHRQRIHHHGFALSLVVAMHAWFVVCAYPPPQPEGLTTDSWLSQHTCVCAMIYGYRENEINASASKANHLSRKHAHRFLAFETHTCVCNLYGNVFVQPHTHIHPQIRAQR